MCAIVKKHRAIKVNFKMIEILYTFCRKNSRHFVNSQRVTLNIVLLLFDSVTFKSQNSKHLYNNKLQSELNSN